MFGARVGIIGSRWALLIQVGHYRFMLGFSLGPQAFLETNMLVSAKRKSCVGFCPTRTPNARGFTLQWNIGLSPDPFNPTGIVMLANTEPTCRLQIEAMLELPRSWELQNQALIVSAVHDVLES